MKHHRLLEMSPLVLLLAFSCCFQLVSNCSMTEFECKRTRNCIRLDQVCDGRDNCGDRSDEEPGCSRKSLKKSRFDINFSIIFTEI